MLNCEHLWNNILDGSAPSVNNENELRTEFQKRATFEYSSSTSTVDSAEPSYTPTEEGNWFDPDSLNCLEFVEDFELFAKETDNQHPWQEDERFDFLSGDWNDWNF